VDFHDGKKLLMLIGIARLRQGEARLTTNATSRRGGRRRQPPMQVARAEAAASSSANHKAASKVNGGNSLTWRGWCARDEQGSHPPAVS
jgi:hypothetical protein